MELDSHKHEQFQSQIQSFINTYWKLYRRNSFINIALVFGGLFLGAAVTITGFMEIAKLPGILGVLITLLVGIQSAFNFGGRAAYLHVIHDEAKVIRDKLRYKVKTQEELEAVVDTFSALRVNAVKQLPLGEGMGVVKSPLKND